MNGTEKVKMRVQKPEVRSKNFKEVELGYTPTKAKKEANRCLHCKIPKCIEGCPVKIQIPEFIAAIKEDNIKKAYEILCESTSLPAVCGRVCPQEKQCESKCVRGIKGDSIAIGSLERYVADEAIKNNFTAEVKVPKKNKKVAIVGSGPAGLTCAGDLAKQGYSVTIYEVLHKAGGVLTYGIPEFRLPKEIVKNQVDSLEKLGVEIKLNIPVGNAITIEELRKEYDAVFIGTGAGLPKFMEIEGEDASGVFSANEILTRINLMGAYKEKCKTPIKKVNRAYIIGGGNVAMDAVRSLKRLGIETHLMYRRSEEELPARKMEVTHAKDVVDCEMVVMALGTSPNHEALKGSNVVLTERGLIQTEEEKTKTSLENVYAGGDAVTGAATVILAMEAGKKAAKEIMEALS